MSDGKRLVFLTTDSKPLRGGIAEYLHQQCETLGQQCSVEMYSTVPNCARFKPNHYQIFELKPRPLRNLGHYLGDAFFLTRKWNTFHYCRRLEQLADDEIKTLAGDQTTVVIGAWSWENHFWCCACRLRRVPYWLICYGLELTSELPKRAACWRKEDLVGASRVIVISSPTGQLVNRLTGGKLATTVIYPRVDVSLYQQPDEEAQIQAKRNLQIPEKASILLSVGRLVKRKGFDLVLEALAELKEEFPNLFYLVVGDGPEQIALRDQSVRLGVTDRVRFLTDISDRQKWIFYALSDVFVMPNRTLGGTNWEGFGIVFLEAGLAGKPSIAGNNGGVPDAVAHGKTGLLVQTENYIETTEAIKILLLDGALRLRMGEAARKKVLRS